MDLNLFLIGSFLLEKMVERAQSVKNTKILALVLLSSNNVLIIVFLLAEANIGHVWILLGFHQTQQSPRKAQPNTCGWNVSGSTGTGAARKQSLDCSLLTVFWPFS